MPIGTLKEATTSQAGFVNSAIQNLHTTHLEYERKLHQLRKLRFMKSRPSAPRPFQGVVSGGLRSPLSYRLVQTVVGMICKERPSFKRLPIDSNDRAAASRLQSSADPMLQDLERLAGRPLVYQFVDQMVADGMGVMKCYRDAWQGFPQKAEGQTEEEFNQQVASFIMRGANHPLRMRLVDPLNFKRPLTNYEAPYILETGKRPTMAVAQAFNLTFGTNNRITILPESTSFNVLEMPASVAPLVDVEELWTADQVFVRIAGKVFTAENDMGFIPYVWSAGETSSHPDISLNSLSILYPYAGIEPWLNTMLTVLASWGVIGGTPILYTSRKLPPGMGAVPDAAPNLADIPLGKRIDLGMGGEIGFVNPPPIGGAVLEFVKFLVDFLDRAGLPSLAYGSIGTRTPGTAFQGALEQAIAKVNPIVNSAEIGLADIVKMQWKLVEQLGKPMYVTGNGIQPSSVFKRKALGRFVIDPKDINGYYDLHAKIRVGNTQDAVSRGMHAAFMRDKQLWSRDRAMEFADVDDPFQEYQDIMRDKVEDSPFVQQQMMMNALMQNPEFKQRAAELEQQGVDVAGLLMGGTGQMGAGGPAGTPPPGGAAPKGNPGRAPAPRRGGKPTGSPKNPGGPRPNAQGSRGHS